MGASCNNTRARQLRAGQTEVERRLWSRLRNRQLDGLKWKRQVPRGPYVVDFLCVEAGLVVELDGGQHADQLVYDARRTAYLESQGLKVLRFWNTEATETLNGVCDAILDAARRRAPHPDPLPRGEREARF